MVIPQCSLREREETHQVCVCVCEYNSATCFKSGISFERRWPLTHKSLNLSIHRLRGGGAREGGREEGYGHFMSNIKYIRAC